MRRGHLPPLSGFPLSVSVPLLHMHWLFALMSLPMPVFYVAAGVLYYGQNYLIYPSAFPPGSRIGVSNALISCPTSSFTEEM